MTWYLADDDPFDDETFNIDIAEPISDRDSEVTPFGSEYTNEAAIIAITGCPDAVDSFYPKTSNSALDALDVALLPNSVNVEPVSPVSPVKSEPFAEPMHSDPDDPRTADQSIPDSSIRPAIQKQVNARVKRARAKAMSQKLELRRRLKVEEQEQAQILPPAARAKLRSRNEAAVSRCFKLSLSDYILTELWDSVEESFVLRSRLRCLETSVRSCAGANQRC